MRELFEVMEMLYNITVVVVTQLSPFAKTQQNLKLVNFIVLYNFINYTSVKLAKEN